MNKPVLTQYDRDAQDFEEVVPKKHANKILDKEIDKRVKEKLNGKPKNNGR